MASREGRIAEVLAVLAELGMPRAQLNERSAHLIHFNGVRFLGPYDQ